MATTSDEDGIVAALRAAIKLRPVRTGLLGTFLILLGSLTPAYLPQNSPWWPTMRTLSLDTTAAKIGGTLLVLLGLGLLIEGWFGLRPAVYDHVKHWAVLAIWSAPLLLGPPTFSHDAYSYAAQGWMLINGINPYEAGPGVLPGAFADQVAWVWRYTPAPYGPLSLRLQEAIVVMAGNSPYLSAVLMRIPALVGVGLITVLLPRIARLRGADPQLTAWFATINPLLVIDFVGGAHNDSLMMGLVVLAIWLAVRSGTGWLPGAVVIGVAAAIKQPAFLAAYALPLFCHPLPSRKLRQLLTTFARVALSSLLAIATFVGISWLCGLGFGWLNAVNVPGLVVTVSPFTILGQAVQFLLNITGLDPGGHSAIRGARALGLAIAVIGVLVMAIVVAPRRPMRFLSWSFLLVAFASPALHSWYVLWGGLLLPMTDPPPRVQRIALWTTVVLLSYSAVNLAWRNGALALAIAALVPLIWRVVRHERRHRDMEPA